MEENVPEHSVIGDFINNYILPNQYEIFTIINKQIIIELNLNIGNAYDDGTKIEAKENLLSLKGIELRINRSIQVEGTFGQIQTEYEL